MLGSRSRLRLLKCYNNWSTISFEKLSWNQCSLFLIQNYFGKSYFPIKINVKKVINFKVMLRSLITFEKMIPTLYSLLNLKFSLELTLREFAFSYNFLRKDFNILTHYIKLKLEPKTKLKCLIKTLEIFRTLLWIIFLTLNLTLKLFDFDLIFPWIVLWIQDFNLCSLIISRSLEISWSN